MTYCAVVTDEGITRAKVNMLFIGSILKSYDACIEAYSQSKLYIEIESLRHASHN